MGEDNTYWGYHGQFDVTACDIDARGPDYLRAWVKALVKDIKMVAYGEPEVVHFGKDDPKLAGWTVVQLIETSNIMAHFCDQHGDLYLDVFSCKEYNPKIVEDNLKRWFNPEKIKCTWTLRNARPD